MQMLTDAENRSNRRHEAGDIETRYRVLFEQSPDGILIIDANGKILDFNEAAHALLGYTREDFARLNISEISGQGPEEMQDHIEHLLIAGKASYEINCRTKNGGTRNVHVLSRMILLSGRTVMHSIWRDITEQKKTETELRKSEKFIKDILESVDEAFIVIDRDYRIVSANKAYLEQVKMPLEEVLGRHCYQVSHRINKPCYEMGEECSVRHTFDAGEPHTALHIHLDKTNNPLYVETKSYPLKDSSGYTTSAIEIIHNTTEKKKLEEQLRHIQKMEAVGQLAGGIAHDFNNILTAITGYGSLIKMKMAEDDPLRQHVQQMLDASERATSLTRGLLAFSRKQVIRPKPVDLNKIVANVEKLLQRIIGEDVEMKVDLTNGDLTVMADCGQVEQVLMNLVANARDAMAESGCLTIRTDIAVLDGAFVQMHGYGKRGTYALIIRNGHGHGDGRANERKDL